MSVCNTCSCRETNLLYLHIDKTWPKGWQPWEPPSPAPTSYFDSRNPCPRDRSIRPLPYLEIYSHRNLTCQSDALNTSIGALDTFAKECIYHIWAGPYHHAGNDAPVSGGLIVHKQHTSRRPELPSWSPLGWRGQPHWYDATKAEKYAMLQAQALFQSQCIPGHATCLSTLQKGKV